ncbi:MAG: peptide chain release factor 2 [Candidatus Omnitrophica bacterium]|nr:peptide chain release factor 2 [Candidatus Omnitrophota bacterium]MCM8791004.1 peptide chain release factor 2 [Candidatus Omnitrophota bacterium]
MLEDIREELNIIEGKLNALRGYFDVDEKLKEISLLESEIARPDFWKDEVRSKDVIRRLKGLKAVTEPFLKIAGDVKDIREITAIAGPDDNESLEHFKKDLAALRKKIDTLEFNSLLSEESDVSNAILSVNAGAGGTESCDWAAMLMRMYIMWAEDKGFSVDVLDQLVGEEAGIKNVTLLVKGPYAYGFLKSESGVHRLVRISPFDSNKRRHTSFASVDVIPEISDDIKIDIKEADLKVDTFRAGGKGGQHVNKTDSAVRITHIPTGIVVQCQSERSQFKNKQLAMKVLKAKMYEKERMKKVKELESAYEAKKEIAWGSQIRSYVLHPYSMVKDHRTDCETSNAQAVLDGEIDPFIEAYLKKAKEKK